MSTISNARVEKNVSKETSCNLFSLIVNFSNDMRREKIFLKKKNNVFVNKDFFFFFSKNIMKINAVQKTKKICFGF